MNIEYFKKFNSLIRELTHQFFVWEYLQKTENLSAYNERYYFWDPTMRALFNNFLLLLINIFDKNNKKVFSVYTYLDKLDGGNKKQALFKEIGKRKYKDILKQLTKWRGNYLAHKNIYFILNPKELGEQYPVKHTEVKKILILLIKIVHITGQNFNAPYDYKFYKKEKELCIKDTQFVIDYGLKK